MFLNGLVKQFAQNSAGYRPDDHVPEQPSMLSNFFNRRVPGILSAQPADGQRQPIFEEIQEYRQQRAGVQGDGYPL